VGKLVLVIVFVYLTLGIFLIYFAQNISVRYNKWTTALRIRFSRLSPPPTPRMTDLNIKIMTWLIRLVGAYVLVSAAFLIYMIWKTVP
jgi:glycopeptide antibiotics resistance protein